MGIHTVNAVEPIDTVYINNIHAKATSLILKEWYSDRIKKQSSI